jgi:hypothetical protein
MRKTIARVTGTTMTLKKSCRKLGDRRESRRQRRDKMNWTKLRKFFTRMTTFPRLKMPTSTILKKLNYQIPSIGEKKVWSIPPSASFQSS